MQKIVVLLLGLCLLGACSRRVGVEINSLVESGAAQEAAQLAGQRCLVLSGDETVNPQDLQFREFAAQLSASLARKGCAPALNLADADLAVFLRYGIGEPFIVEERSYVVYRPWGRWGRGMAEYIPVTTSYIFNTGSLHLDARRVEKAAPPSGGTQKGRAPSRLEAETEARPGKQLWKLDAAHAGQRVDLRALFPWLLAAARDYYGVDSGQNILIRVREEDLPPLTPPAQHIARPPAADAPAP